MGCKARGQPGQPFDHKSGHGYVKGHRSLYHDAIFVKRNNFNLLLHETFGGGFSPTPPFSSCAASRAKSRAAALTAQPTRPSSGWGYFQAASLHAGIVNREPCVNQLAPAPSP